MIGAQFSIFIVVLLMFSGVYAQQASGVASEVSQSEALSTGSAQCPAKQVLENRRIINECNASWTKWGIEKPNDFELRSENQCTGVFSSTTAMACGKAIIAFPVFIAQTTSAAINTAFPDKSSYEYISKYGTKIEITAYFKNKFINQKCGSESYTLLKQQEEECKMMNEYGRMDSLEDSEREMWTTKCSETQIKIQCHLNPPTPNRLQDEAMNRSIAKMVADVQALQTEEAEAQAKQNEVDKRIREIRMSCNKVDTSFSTLFSSSMAAAGSGMFQMPSTTETTNPEKFQDCVMAEIGNDERLKKAFEEKSVSFLQPILNQVPAFKCYNEEVRRQFYCEMSMVALSGGSALAPAVARRLGTQVVVQAAKKMGVTLSEESVRKAARGTVSVLSGEAVENTMLRPMTSVLDQGRSLVGRALSSNEVQVVQKAFDRGYDYVRNTFLNASQSVLEVEKLLGRKLTPEQQSALLRAKRIGSNRDVAFGGYTRDQLLEKDEILKEAGFTAEERMKLLQSGATNSSGVVASGEAEDATPVPANDNGPPELRIAASAEPSAASSLGTRTAEFTNMIKIENKYLGEPVQIKSLSGGNYEGEFVGFQSVNGEMAMILKTSEGKEIALRVANLDLATIKSNKNSVSNGFVSLNSSSGVADLQLTEIDDLYNGQQIEVKSLTGLNTYSGRFVTFDNTGEGILMVIKNNEGKETSVPLTNLDLNTWKGKPREFIVSSRGRVTPTTGTPIGNLILNFKTRTGLDLEITTGPLMKEDFFINYERGTVILNQKLASNPARIEELLKAEIPRRLIVDRQARANLVTNHGLRLNTYREIEVVNPTSTFGRMIRDLKKNHGTVVTLGDPGLGASRGVSFTDLNRISLNPDLLLPGRETDLLGVLRHEVKHNTVDRGSSEYSLMAGPSPNVTALRYAGQNIAIDPANDAAKDVLSRSGVYGVYQDGFRADEFEARLTQFTPNSGARGSYQDNSNMFMRNQSTLFNFIQKNDLSPETISFNGNITEVKYRVKVNDTEIFVTVPIKGQVPSIEEATRIARMVIDQRQSDFQERVRRSQKTSP